MSKVFMITAFLFLTLTSCSSTNERAIASVEDQACSVEKHPKKEYYRVMLKGKPYNKFWYGRNYTEKLKSRLAAKGRCM
jgi:hypothetical protein